MVRFLPTMLEPLVAGIAAAVGVTHPAAAAMQDPATDPGCVNVRVAIQVTRPGTYRVALGQKAWIDVVRGRAGVASSAHAMGPRCTGVAKLVDFPLRPGRYVMQLTGAPAPTLPATIVRVK
jgi:hypothetical protein